MGNSRNCEKCLKKNACNRYWPHCHSCHGCRMQECGIEDHRTCKNRGLNCKSKNCSSNALQNGHFLNNGRYRIERVLGEGGYGITYEATDLWHKRKVAVKEFFPAYALYRSANKVDAVCVNQKAEADLAHTRIRFNQEAALLIALKNVKEIVTVYQSFEENKTAYYTMELLQGTDMQKHLQVNGRMFWHELSPIVIQILRALYATHQMGYIHRDITPDNIFLLGNGSARLIDFGNARRYKKNQQLTEIVKDKFAPREQYSRSGNQGPWTDIYSLCVTIYYAMTGVLPKKATELSSTVDPLPALYTLVDIPLTVSQAVQKGMSVEEGRRYQSIADFAYALYPGQSVLGTLPRQISAQRSFSQMVQRRNHAQSFPAKQSVTMRVQQQENAPRQTYGNISDIGNQPILVCTRGIMNGFCLNLPAGQIQTIGRDEGKIIQYPNGTSGVSRNQCSLLLQNNGVVYVRDDSSSYGTAVNGYKLTPGIWKPLKPGDVISFGRESYVLR